MATVGEQRYYPFGETRLSTGTMVTDKLFTGQRAMEDLGIYHYGARFYSPKLGRFLSADSIVPGYADPQNLNRYSYVGNSPLNYTDPTGHARIQDGPQQDKFKPALAKKYVPKPSKSNKSNKLDKHKGKQGGSSGNSDTSNVVSNDECKTVTCNALAGDPMAIADLLIPTHFGWRLQGEGSATVGPGAGAGVSGTLGVNVAWNRYSNELGLFLDLSIEGGGGVGPPLGGSATTGPIIGWGSSTLKDVADGDSYIISGTGSYIAAVSVAVTAPRDGPNLHVDPIYGQIPVTGYGGAGVGTPYGSVGGGTSHVFASWTTDLDTLFP